MPFGSDPFFPVRNKRTVIKYRYIQVNVPWARVWMVFDLDIPDARLQALADLPAPCWIASSPDTGRAHIAFQLDAPILTSEYARQKPLRYAAAIEAALTEKLQADAGYSGLITKNPLHKYWNVEWNRHAYPYTLGFLAEWLDLPKHLPKRPIRNGLGRNCDTFDFMRAFAYRHVLKAESFVAWNSRLCALGTEFTQTEHKTPLGYREVQCISRSIAKWTWQHFTEEGKTAWHKKGQAAMIQKRRKRNAERDQAIIEALHSGENQRKVAALCGVSLGTVSNIKRRYESESDSFAISDNESVQFAISDNKPDS